MVFVLLPGGVTEKKGDAHGLGLTVKEGKGQTVAGGEITLVTEHGEESSYSKSPLQCLEETEMGILSSTERNENLLPEIVIWHSFPFLSL